MVICASISRVVSMTTLTKIKSEEPPKASPLICLLNIDRTIGKQATMPKKMAPIRVTLPRILVI